MNAKLVYHLFLHQVQLALIKSKFFLVPFPQLREVSWNVLEDRVGVHEICSRTYGFTET